MNLSGKWPQIALYGLGAGRWTVTRKHDYNHRLAPFCAKITAKRLLLQAE